MSYPVTITPAYDCGDSPTGVYGCAYGGAVYRFLADSQSDITGASSTFGYLHCHKSTDAGLTWTEQDSAHAPRAKPSTSGAGYPKFTAVMDGATVQLIWIREHTTSGTRFIDGLTGCIFNLAAGTWGTPVDFSAASMDYVTVVRIVISMTVRAPGDYLVFYSSTRSSGNARMSYSTYNGADAATPALSGETALPSQSGSSVYVPTGVVADPDSGTALFVYTAGNSIRSVGMDSGGSFGTPVTHATFGYSVSNTTSSPIVYDHGGTQHFAFAGYVGEDHDRVRVYDAAVAINPSWSSTVAASGFDGDDILPFAATAVYIARAMTIGVSTDLVGLLAVGVDHSFGAHDADKCQFYAFTAGLAVAWTIWKQNTSPYYWGYAGVTSATGSISWSTPAELFLNPSPPGSNGVQSYHVCAFDMASTPTAVLHNTFE